MKLDNENIKDLKREISNLKQVLKFRDETIRTLRATIGQERSEKEHLLEALKEASITLKRAAKIAREAGFDGTEDSYNLQAQECDSLIEKAKGGAE